MDEPFDINGKKFALESRLLQDRGYCRKKSAKRQQQPQLY